MFSCAFDSLCSPSLAQARGYPRFARIVSALRRWGVPFVALFWVECFPALRGSFAGAKGRCGLG